MNVYECNWCHIVYFTEDHVPFQAEALWWFPSTLRTSTSYN